MGNTMNDEELKARFKTIAERLLPHVGMLLLLPHRNAKPEDVLNNGTASFIDTGCERLLVTCSHVIDCYQKIGNANPDAVLAVTGNSGTQPVIVSDAEVISNGGKQLDLATMRLPDPDRITWGGKSYFKAEVWPPVRAQKGQVAVLAGFPGMHRDASSRGLEVRATPICDFVTSVSERNIYLVDEDLARVAVKHNPELSDLASLGGMSGSAVYVVDEDRQVPLLAGFMYEAGEGTHASIFIAHADSIRADGTLDHGFMPW
ncbi:MAG: hypothetical protein Kow00105_10450 [Phycisphaeraceae bacterium]